MSCGIGDTRRDVVIRLLRSVNAWTLDSRIAFLPGGCDFAADAGDARKRVRVRAASRAALLALLLRMMIGFLFLVVSLSGICTRYEVISQR